MNKKRVALLCIAMISSGIFASESEQKKVFIQYNYKEGNNDTYWVLEKHSRKFILKNDLQILSDCLENKNIFTRHDNENNNTIYKYNKKLYSDDFLKNFYELEKGWYPQINYKQAYDLYDLYNLLNDSHNDNEFELDNTKDNIKVTYLIVQFLLGVYQESKHCNNETELCESQCLNDIEKNETFIDHLKKTAIYIIEKGQEILDEENNSLKDDFLLNIFNNDELNMDYSYNNKNFENKAIYELKHIKDIIITLSKEPDVLTVFKDISNCFQDNLGEYFRLICIKKKLKNIKCKHFIDDEINAINNRLNNIKYTPSIKKRHVLCFTGLIAFLLFTIYKNVPKDVKNMKLKNEECTEEKKDLNMIETNKI